MRLYIKFNITLLSIISNFFLISVLFFILKLDTIRVELYQQLVRHFGKIEIVLVGDSLTRRNSDIAMLVGGFRFNAINIAIDGYTIPQIVKQSNDLLLPLSPCLVIVMAGTNRQEMDSLNSNLIQYEKMLDGLLKQSIDVILLETLLTQRANLNSYINQLNENLKIITMKKNISYFSSNTYLTENGRLLDKYSEDGVHLSLLGYETINKNLLPFINQKYSSKRLECNNIL